MHAANYIAPGRIEARSDATAPEPAPGEVIIAVEACGICGSDLHMFRNDSLRDKLVRKTPENYQVPGHEFAGRIAEIGRDVTGWTLGERVVGVTGLGGGMAQFVAVPVNPFQLVRIPQGVSFVAAATTEPLADGLQMVRKAAIRPGENIVVFGVGIIGLGVIQAILAKGIEVGAIIAVDIHQPRLDRALALGATHAVTPRDGDLFEAIAAICGREEDYRGTSANIGVVFECAGYIKHIPGPPPLETALRLIANGGGRIICFGAYEGRLLIDLEPLIEKQPIIIGSNGYAAEELVEALELMRQGRADRDGLVTGRFPLSEIDLAFEAQSQPGSIKVIIDIPQSPPAAWPAGNHLA